MASQFHDDSADGRLSACPQSDAPEVRFADEGSRGFSDSLEMDCRGNCLRAYGDFEIHNSSAAAYAAIYGDLPEVQRSVLFGVPRAFRLDEYNVQLPYYFSQYYNGYGQISHQMSVSGQDMIMGYNAPVLALSLLGKPQTWGYLLFGNAKGLAWYTSFKTIMTFMAAFEMTLVLTRSRYMGLFGGFSFCLPRRCSGGFRLIFRCDDVVDDSL